MSLTFKPKTEKEISESNLIPVGIYPFEVLTAESATSKKGNPMMPIELRLFMPDGTERTVFSFLMEAMPAQLFHFCTYSGLSVQYGNGTLKPEDCIGKTGYAKIGIQKGKSKDDGSGEFWPDRNSVLDYVRPEALKLGAMANKIHDPVKSSDEDVPYG